MFVGYGQVMSILILKAFLFALPTRSADPVVQPHTRKSRQFIASLEDIRKGRLYYCDVRVILDGTDREWDQDHIQCETSVLKSKRLSGNRARDAIDKSNNHPLSMLSGPPIRKPVPRFGLPLFPVGSRGTYPTPLPSPPGIIVFFLFCRAHLLYPDEEAPPTPFAGRKNL